MQHLTTNQRAAWHQHHLQHWLNKRVDPASTPLGETPKVSKNWCLHSNLQRMLSLLAQMIHLRARWQVISRFYGSDIRNSSSGVCCHNGEELLLIDWRSGRNISHVWLSNNTHSITVKVKGSSITHFLHLHQCRTRRSCCGAPRRWCSPQVLEPPAWGSSDWSFPTHHHQTAWRPSGFPLWGLAPGYDQSLNRSPRDDFSVE